MLYRGCYLLFGILLPFWGMPLLLKLLIPTIWRWTVYEKEEFQRQM